MSWLSDVVNHAVAEEHHEVDKVINRLPPNLRPIARGVSNTIAGHGLGGGRGGAGGRFSPTGAPHGKLPGPPRPADKGCGYGDMNPSASGRRPYQFVMTLAFAAGAAVTQSSFSADASLGEFVATTSCSMLLTNNQFPSYFASDAAFVTVSAGNPITGAGAAGEVDSRLDALEIVEKHDNQEVARYPLRSLLPRVARTITDQTGSAVDASIYQHPGVTFPQAWMPQRTFSITLVSQAPTYNLTSPLVVTLALVGSIGAPNNCAT